jgi:hypothetical protein
MPQFFSVVVVDDDGSLSPTVTAILGGPGLHGVSPYFLPAYVFAAVPFTHGFVEFAYEHDLRIMQAIALEMIDPREVDLWIVLSPGAEVVVRRRVDEAGPAPDNFYRHPFPDPVVQCGFSVPAYPKHGAGVDLWFDELRDLFAPWKDRIMRAFSDSS